MIVVSDEELSKFQILLNALKANWVKVKPQVTGGLMSMVTFDKTALSAGFKEVTLGIGQLVNLAELLTISGPDKKLLVVEYANDLFDYVVRSTVPTALIPIILPVESVLESMLDGLIEAEVSKLPAPVVPAPVVPTP